MKNVDIILNFRMTKIIEDALDGSKKAQKTPRNNHTIVMLTSLQKTTIPALHDVCEKLFPQQPTKQAQD